MIISKDAIKNILNKILKLDKKVESHTHTIAQVNNLQSTLDGKASSTHNHDFNSLSNLPTTLSGYGITNVYTKTEINNKINSKTNVQSGEIITTNNDTIGYFKNIKINGNTRYKKSDKTYTDTWESVVSLESMGEKEKNSNGKYPIEVFSCNGENLMRGTVFEKSHADYTLEDGRYTVSGDSTLNWAHVSFVIDNLVVGAEYVCSCFIESSGNKSGIVQLVDGNNETLIFTRYAIGNVGESFIATSPTMYLRLFANNNEYNGVKRYSNVIVSKKHNKRTILLDSPLRKVGTIADVLDLEKMKVTRNCKTAIFDGSSDENWTYAGNNIFALPFTGYKKVDLTTNSLLMCDKFTVTSHNVLNNISGNYIAFESSYTSDNYLRIRKPDATDLATFTTWLQSNPVTVVYQLATPTTEDIDVSSNTLTDFATGCTLTIDNTIKGNIECNEIVGLIPSVEENGTRLTNVENSLDNKAEKSHTHTISNVTGLQDKLDEVFQSVSNGKTLLETAITDKGSSVSKAGNVATFEELKTGIAGISTGVCELNIFTQTEEPSTKDGLWLKTSNTYDDVLNISDTEYGDTYTKMTDIPYNFYDGSAVAIGNDIYILGGNDNKTANYKYDTTTDTYTKMANIPDNFYNGSAVAIGNDIYLLGSSYNYRHKINYKYNTTTNTYTKMDDIPYNFYDGSAVAIGNDIYLLGSSDGDYYKINYKYDTTTDTYTEMTDIPYNFFNGSAVAIGNDIYLLGTYRGSYSKNNYKYITTVLLCKNSILFLYDNESFKYKTKIFNTSYERLGYINFDSVIMTDENGNNANVETYIGNGTSWNKI